METRFKQTLLKKELIKQGQELEQENLVLQEKNKALTARNKGLYEDLELEKGRTTALRDKNDSQGKEISNLNIKIKTLEGKIYDMTNDWASDSLAAEKQIDILKAELKSANSVADNRTVIIEALKAENAKLEKANNRNNYINLFLGGLAFMFFVYICWTM